MNDFEKKQKAQIAQRRKQMPKSYRANYDSAMTGKSRRAAIKAFCLECVCWQVEEVRCCTDLGCSLYSVRPYQERSQNGCSEGFIEPGATKSVQPIVSTPQIEAGR
jgi:hypothetical protein